MTCDGRWRFRRARACFTHELTVIQQSWSFVQRAVTKEPVILYDEFRLNVITVRFMTRSDACSEAEWMAETIVDDFAMSLDLSERVRFYARMVELLTERRNQVQRALDGSDPEPESLEQVH